LSWEISLRIFNKTFEAFALSLGLETLEISNGQGYDKRRLTEGLQTGKRRPAPLYLSAFGIFLIIKEIQKVYEFFYQGKSLLQKIEHSAEDYFRSFKAGEELGFNYFFHLYFKPLVHFAYSIVNSLQAAEDVVEDSFIKLWEKREAIEAPGLKSYLYASVRNGCIDLLRRNDHHEVYLNNIAEKPEQIAIDISHKIIMTEAMRLVYTAL
jgi:hypothetical protein